VNKDVVFMPVLGLRIKFLPVTYVRSKLNLGSHSALTHVQIANPIKSIRWRAQFTWSMPNAKHRGLVDQNSKNIKNIA
jgi:hypothetical protein